MSTEPEDFQKPGTSKLSVIILGVGLAALAGSGAMVVMARPSGAKDKPAKHASGDHGDAGETDAAEAEGDEADDEGSGGAHGKAGAIAKLEPFIANLSSSDGEMHYVKCTLAAEVASEHAAAEIDKRTPRIRQEVILYLSSLTLADTNGGENKKKIHAALEATVQKIVGKKNAKHIYITEFVIQ